jgi:hypothetical protein
VEVNGIKDQMETEIRQEASVKQEYDRLQARFPKTPLPREILKSAVGAASGILRQTVYPDRVLAQVSRALSAIPQIELDKLDWEISSNPRARAAPAAAKAAGAPVEAPAAPVQGETDRIYEVVEIAGHINAIKISDYRGINTVVEQFVQALRQQPGLEVIGTRSPFDALNEKAVAGDVGEQERDEVPVFSVTVSRRIGT